MKTFTAEENKNLLRVMWHKLIENDPSAKYVIAMMRVYSRIYSTTVKQLDI